MLELHIGDGLVFALVPLQKFPMALPFQRWNSRPAKAHQWYKIWSTRLVCVAIGWSAQINWALSRLHTLQFNTLIQLCRFFFLPSSGKPNESSITILRDMLCGTRVWWKTKHRGRKSWPLSMILISFEHKALEKKKKVSLRFIVFISLSENLVHHMVSNALVLALVPFLKFLIDFPLEVPFVK